MDTWAWVALADRRDTWHQMAMESYLNHKHSLRATSDYVLDETISLLFARLPFNQARQFVERIWTLQSQGRLSVIPISASRFRAAWDLRLRYRDKPAISFTDLTSFVLIEEFGIPYVLTGDAHFTQVGLPCKVLPG